MTHPLNRVNNAVKVPFYYALYLKIAEPRVIRIMLFVVYLCCLWAGAAMLISLPHQFIRIIGQNLVLLFGVFIILGSILAACAVLPGVWWLERVGIILLTTSVAMYAILLVFLEASSVAVGFIFAVAWFFGIRWLEISGAQLAPRDA